jgi:hypothetical protein
LPKALQLQKGNFMADSSSQTNVAPSPAAMNATDEREKSKKISGLSALWPFM